jgi:TrmH family RNA methyltransferase
MTPLTKREAKDIKSLATKKGRTQKKQFVAEGVRVIEEALRHQRQPERVYCAEARLSQREASLTDKLQDVGIPVTTITSAQLRSISATETPSGLLAVFREIQVSVRELISGNRRRVLLCDGIADPGNLGTLMRSALAFGFDGLITDQRTADPFAAKVVRSSAGAVFGLDIGRSEAAEVDDLLPDRAAHLIAADLSGRPLPRSIGRNLADRPLILALGAEATGVSDWIVKAADRVWRVRQSGGVESLNVAMAGSIIMHRLFEDSKE